MRIFLLALRISGSIIFLNNCMKRYAVVNDVLAVKSFPFPTWLNIFHQTLTLIVRYFYKRDFFYNKVRHIRSYSSFLYFCGIWHSHEVSFNICLFKKGCLCLFAKRDLDHGKNQKMYFFIFSTNFRIVKKWNIFFSAPN